MKMRLLILLLSFCIFGTIYYVFEKNNGYSAQSKYLGIDPSEITSLGIQFNGQQYNFSRKDTKWQTSSPHSKYIDQRIFDFFLRGLCGLPISRKIIEHSEKEDMFGLKHPFMRIDVIYGLENKSISVLLGNENEANTSIYAKKSDAPDIVLIGKLIKEDALHVIHMVKN